MADIFGRFDEELDSPASRGYNPTPSDAADLAFTSRWLHIGGAGTLNVIFANDTANTTITATAGSILPFRVKRIWATGTTATNIVVGY